MPSTVSGPLTSHEGMASHAQDIEAAKSPTSVDTSGSSMYLQVTIGSSWLTLFHADKTKLRMPRWLRSTCTFCFALACFIVFFPLACVVAILTALPHLICMSVICAYEAMGSSEPSWLRQLEITVMKPFTFTLALACAPFMAISHNDS